MDKPAPTPYGDLVNASTAGTKMMAVDERLKTALLEALACADEAGNMLIAAMLADCLARTGWQDALEDERS